MSMLPTRVTGLGFSVTDLGRAACHVLFEPVIYSAGAGRKIRLPTKPPVEAPTKPPLEPQPTKEQIQPTAVPATKESPPTEIPTKSPTSIPTKTPWPTALPTKAALPTSSADKAASADKHRDAVQCLGRFSGG